MVIGTDPGSCPSVDEEPQEAVQKQQLFSSQKDAKPQGTPAYTWSTKEEELHDASWLRALWQQGRLRGRLSLLLGQHLPQMNVDVACENEPRDAMGTRGLGTVWPKGKRPGWVFGPQ